jgi:hypothetical protein
MKSFRRRDRVVVRGILELAGMHGEVISFPGKRGAAWIRLDDKIPNGGVPFQKSADGSVIVSLFPYECDPEEKA